MAELAVSTEHLTRYFGDRRAVEDLSLSVPRGSVYGLLGPNGAGKTTTIRLLLGLLAPTSGRVRVLGHSIPAHADQVRAATGALLEHHGLYEGLTAHENLVYHGRLRRLPTRELEARIQELLTHVDLSDRQHDPVQTFSRGMRQRLALARTLVHAPTLLFLDEPTTGLDPEAAAAFRDDVMTWSRERGTTILLTTHNLSEAERICSHVGIMRNGRLMASGPPDALQGPGAQTTDEAGSHARHTGSPVGSGLEDAYLSIMRSPGGKEG